VSRSRIERWRGLGLGLGLALGLLWGGASPAHAQDNDAAMEWSFGGALRVRGFALGSGTELKTTTFNTGEPASADSTITYLDSRLRLSLRATAYQEVSAVMAIEVGDLRFGDENAPNPGSPSTPGKLGTDAVAFENKNLYLEWHPTRYSFKVRAGLYPRESDPYGLVLSNDVAGIHAEVELLGTSTVLYVDAIKALENSRNDLDGDGFVDNDYNDRNVLLYGVTTSIIEGVSLEAFGIADLDNSEDIQALGDREVEIYWAGFNGRGRFGPVQIATTWIGAWGERVGDGPDERVRGFATDNRLTIELPFITLQGILAYASGRDPDELETDDAFPVITPFYGASSIVYQDLGGFNVTGSNLSGTAHATLKVLWAPLDDLDVEVYGLWAWYTSDRDVTGNVNQFNEDARDVGAELGLNLGYELAPGFQLYARGAIFFPSKGFLVEQDTNRRGALSQLILGAQLSF
jgi:hypothetical protein